MANWPVLTLISVMLGFGGFVAVILLYMVTGGDYPLDFGVVVDAGSSHTQLTLYHWLADKNRCTGLVEQVDTKKVDGGIAAFNDSDGVGDRLLPDAKLLQEKIDHQRLASAAIYLGATAGIRILNLTDSHRVNRIFTSVRQAFANLTIKTKSISIISGADEGLFSWITTNYLAKTLMVDRLKDDESSTFGMLDMGGASAQIAYRLTDRLKNSTPPVENIDVRLYGINHTVKASSNLCFGNDQARYRYWHLLITGNEGNNLVDPCLYKDVQNFVRGSQFEKLECIRTKNGKTIDTNLNYTFTGSGDSKKCKEVVFDQLLNLDKCKDNYYYCFNTSASSPPDNTQFYALSTYYYSTRVLNLTEKVTPQEFELKMNKFCSENFSTILSMPNVKKEYAKNYCFQMHYIFGTLNNIYKFTNKTWPNLRFANSINGAQLGWSLGFMINATNAIPADKPSGSWLSTSEFVIFTIVCLLVLCFSIYFIYKWFTDKRDDKERYEPISIRA